MTTLFISDLHLDDDRPEITELLLNFLDQRAIQAEALYILGDLFEVWIGDDDSRELTTRVGKALQKLSNASTAVFFIHGNRDFLLGESYAQRAAMRLLPQTAVIDLYGQQTLIMHGDTLCTDDTEYQEFRIKVRDPLWQRQILALPLQQRRHLAGQLRETSRAATSLKADDITDVNPEAVQYAFQQHRVDLLIHGHTHRPAIHHLDCNNRPSQRIVLGDWHEQQGSVLVCTPGGQRLETLSPISH